MLPRELSVAIAVSFFWVRSQWALFLLPQSVCCSAQPLRVLITSLSYSLKVWFGKPFPSEMTPRERISIPTDWQLSPTGKCSHSLLYVSSKQWGRVVTTPLVLGSRGRSLNYEDRQSYVDKLCPRQTNKQKPEWGPSLQRPRRICDSWHRAAWSFPRSCLWATFIITSGSAILSAPGGMFYVKWKSFPDTWTHNLSISTWNSRYRERPAYITEKCRKHCVQGSCQAI